MRLLAEVPPGRVLDAPCGDGALAQALAALGHRVWACDLEPAVSAQTGNIRFCVVDLNDPLPYPDSSFDAIVSLEAIEHLELPGRCLEEFARLLRVGGRLVISAPNVNNVQSRFHYFFTGQFSGFKTLARRALEPREDRVHWHVTIPYLPTLAYLLTRNHLALDAVDVTMIKLKQWFLLPFVFVMWFGGRRARPSTLTRLLGSWKLLLGRSVILRAVKAGTARPKFRQAPGSQLPAGDP